MFSLTPLTFRLPNHTPELPVFSNSKTSLYLLREMYRIHSALPFLSNPTSRDVRSSTSLAAEPILASYFRLRVGIALLTRPKKPMGVGVDVVVLDYVQLAASWAECFGSGAFSFVLFSVR